MLLNKTLQSLCKNISKRHQSNKTIQQHTHFPRTRRTHGKQKLYQSLRVSPLFSLGKETLSLADIIGTYDDVLVRDVVALSLQDTALPTSLPPPRPAPVLMSSGKSIVVALGNVKMMLRPDQCHFFDVHVPLVYSTICEITATASMLEGDKNSSPFELCMLEALLRTVCARYSRRAKLYAAAVEHVMRGLVQEEADDRLEILTQLLPLKDGIAAFAIQVDEALNTLVEVLDNDQDMADLNISAGPHSQQSEAHEEVEFLLESYHRQLFLVKHELELLHKRVKSREQLAFMALDVYRNSLIRMDVRLSLAAVCFGFSTTVSGFFGMNLVSGLETAPLAFPLVIMGCSTAATLVFTNYASILKSAGGASRDVKSLTQIESLRNLFDNMGPIEHALWASRNQASISRQGFARLLGSAYSKQETDMLFTMLDASKDGTLELAEVWKKAKSFD